MKRDALTTELPDSFDTLLRAAVDAPDVVPSILEPLRELSPGAALSGGRFRVRRFLGRGGMGAVYEAEDTTTGASVALKVLNRVEPQAVKRFKVEFRTLADTVHPRLVRLHELFVENGVWFFTMDCIDGVTLSAHLAKVGPPGNERREREVRRLLTELVDGVNAIHATGHLHRDLKPSNVLVTRQGRVVVVDFGLAADLTNDGTGRAPEVLGTATYMSPEKARGEPVTTASDWYAVGTILYEALTGRPPMEGDSASVMGRKRRSETPRLFAGGERWPADLAALCEGLLSTDAASRPGAAAILQTPGAVTSEPRTASAEPVFVGRTNEHGALEGALDRARGGKLVVCRVSGPPGIGKTALVRHFVRRAADEHGAVSLSGRCHEREATPFKMLEGVVDALSDAVRRLSPRDHAAMGPLSALFLGGTADAASRASAGLTEAEVRLHAVKAFRAGLAALPHAAPVIVHIDDVQWGDADGAVLLDEILEGATVPLLVVLTHRSGAPSPALDALACTRFLKRAAVVELSVGGITRMDVEAIVRNLAGDRHALDIELIARDSGGSPYFAAEIVRHALEEAPRRRPGRADETPTLESTLLSRFENLPSTAQKLLAAIAVCDGPVPLRLLEAAIAGEGDDCDRSLALLRSVSFARSARPRDVPCVEPYHDRVREVIQSALPESDRRGLHLALASAFESLSPESWEQMLFHFERAGESAKAAICARQSAERAVRAQAFEHAAAMYRRALELKSWEPEDERSLHEHLGDALANAGHNAEAADAYDRAAQGAGRSGQVRLQMLAASQLLSAGQVLAGFERLKSSVEYLGISIPEDDAAMFERASACMDEAMERATDLVYLSEAEADPEQLLRADACWWAVVGLQNLSHVAGPILNSLHLLEAVCAGEPTRIARAAYMQAANLSTWGAEAFSSVIASLMALGDDAAQVAPSPRVHFRREWSLAWQAHFAFDIERSGVHVSAAFEHARGAGEGLDRELGLLSILEALVLLARFEDPAELGRCEAWFREAQRRGDLGTAAWAAALDPRWWLDDAPAPKRAELIALVAELTRTHGNEHAIVWAVHSMLSWIERYMDRSYDALDRMARVMAIIRPTITWTIPQVRATYGVEFVASAIAHAEASGQPLQAETDAVISELPPELSGTADMLRAGIAHLNGDRAGALALLERAHVRPGMARSRVVSASASYFADGIRGVFGPSLEVHVMLRQGCGDPERLFHSWWPGFRRIVTG
jgi:hypothetical protein